jgi:hypothetical protein
VSPFFAYYRFHLRLTYELAESAQVPNAGERIGDLIDIRKKLEEN